MKKLLKSIAVVASGTASTVVPPTATILEVVIGRVYVAGTDFRVLVNVDTVETYRVGSNSATIADIHVLPTLDVRSAYAYRGKTIEIVAANGVAATLNIYED